VLATAFIGTILDSVLDTELMVSLLLIIGGGTMLLFLTVIVIWSGAFALSATLANYIKYATKYDYKMVMIAVALVGAILGALWMMELMVFALILKYVFDYLKDRVEEYATKENLTKAAGIAAAGLLCMYIFNIGIFSPFWATEGSLVEVTSVVSSPSNTGAYYTGDTISVTAVVKPKTQITVGAINQAMEICVFPIEWNRDTMGYMSVPMGSASPTFNCCLNNVFCVTRIVTLDWQDTLGQSVTASVKIPSMSTVDTCNNLGSAFSASGKYAVVAGTFNMVAGNPACGTGYTSALFQQITAYTTTTTSSSTTSTTTTSTTTTTLGHCPNGYCETGMGENYLNCPQDCTTTTTLAPTCPSPYFTTPPQGAQCSAVSVGGQTCYQCGGGGGDMTILVGGLAAVGLVGAFLYSKRKAPAAP
jgi:hypothetical protein